MLRVLLALLLLAVSATPSRADTGLTDAVAGAYFPRYTDAGLHEIAHRRVAEISACEDCFNHTGQASGTAEVIGVNTGYPDPVSRVVVAWGASAPHHAILSDVSYGRIGCAELVVGDEHFFACVLAAGPLPPPAVSSTGSGDAPGFLLPDTALPPPEGAQGP